MAGDAVGDSRLAEEFVRILGPVMGEATPVTVVDAVAFMTGVRADLLVVALPRLRGALDEVRGSKRLLTREAVAVLSEAEALLQEAPATKTREVLEAALAEARGGLARELSRLHSPVPVIAAEALPLARWMFGVGPPPRGAAVLELARCLDDFCQRSPLSPTDLEALRSLARRADAERDWPGWTRLLERLRTIRPRLLPRKALPPLYRSLAGVSEWGSQEPRSLEALLR
ncbi:hypothetical protein [Myxococcus dinghuensis]|uniref:hypothetical protein n=1 Tax=Myxococcus dinghuensis TaxID=2906761 RepID=UPI0020A81331|nr:hypothetical protein [Myxococcus dinghuensis]